MISCRNLLSIALSGVIAATTTAQDNADTLQLSEVVVTGSNVAVGRNLHCVGCQPSRT